MPVFPSLGLALFHAAALLLQDCAITAERVDALLAEAVPAVEKELGVELAPFVHVRLCGRDEVAAIVASENEGIMRAQLPDEESARAHAQAFGRALAATLLAKYSWSSGELLVVGDNFAVLAAQIERPELCSDETLRAILLHELVHLDDHRRLKFDAVLAGLGSSDRLQAYNAVIEGHAQHVARRICAAHGWSGGFEAYTASIGALPINQDQGEAMTFLLKIAAATASASYVQGERFIAGIEGQGGMEAVARAFADPPADLEVIYHPAWFLDSSSRPKASFDFDAAHAFAQEIYSKEDWICTVVTVNPEQLRLTTAMIPPAEQEKMLEGLVANRLMAFNPKATPQSKQIAFVLYELRSVQDALEFVTGEELVLRAKDEQMKTGAVRIIESEYRALSAENLTGLMARKKVQVGPGVQTVLILSAARGRLVVETMFVEEGIADDEHIALALDLLRRAGGE